MLGNTSERTISVVIVTWNGKTFVLECLDSLRSLKCLPATEIIVVDNASTDGTPEAIRELHPEVTLIQNETNLGFAKANNIGIAASSGQVITLINSDVVVPEGCLDKMASFMSANPDIGLMGPRMISSSGEIGHSVYRLPTLWNCMCVALGLYLVFPRSALFGGYLMSEYRYDRTEDVEVLTGWFWMVPRRALHEVGGLDERFFMYGEDLDWSYRFRQLGWRVVFYSDAQAIHHGAASSARAPCRFYVEKVRANLRYFRKHYGGFCAIGFIVTMVIHEVLRIAAYTVLYCINGDQRPVSAFKLRRSISCLGWVVAGSIESQECGGS